jgi:serine/threonine protein kinase
VVKVNAEAKMNDSEYDISKMLSDLNINGFPKVFSRGLIQNQPYIIMEKLGMSLKDILKKNKRHFTVKCILTIGIRLISLLQKLHNTGYIHCDIKPDNIMIGDYNYDVRLRN